MPRGHHAACPVQSFEGICTVGVRSYGEGVAAGEGSPAHDHSFGNYLDPRSACAIGLLPPQLLGKVRPVGNAAGAGAKVALLSRHGFRRAGAIARAVKYVELSAHPRFSNIFTASLKFPEPQNPEPEDSLWLESRQVPQKS
ncbi:MAG: ASKHA domain-containing protein [Bacillota bacterium]